MTASELIKLIPPNTFRELAVETGVDSQVKKLSGELIFKLILFSMLNSEQLSLRVMETFLQSYQFKAFSKYDILDGKYNSLSDRICSINAEYFEKLFNKVFAIYSKQIKDEKTITKTDSTYVGIAAKLFSKGMEGGSPNRRFVKFSVNLKGSIPSSVKVFTDASYANENKALTEVIMDDKHLEGEVIVFDRGLQQRAAYDKIANGNRLFIGRANPDIRIKLIKSIKIGSKPEKSTVTIIKDNIGFLINRKQKYTEHSYRIIEGIINKTGNRICFVTNILDEDAYQVAQWYKQRWEIETFFKHIKQHLNVKHLVSRNTNGIKVMIYMTMILATLLIAYKKINSIKSFKIAKLKFELDLDNDILKVIVQLCGGDPAKAPHLFSSA